MKARRIQSCAQALAIVLMKGEMYKGVVTRANGLHIVLAQSK